MSEEQLNKITNKKLGEVQRGQIKVHTQIINDLSSGIYSSPASCVKELINNSYDAEAKRVTIRIRPIQDSITVMDNGNGMNAEDFDNNFAWISKSNKRNYGEVSPNLKRPLVGKIGIGFIAVNEICDELEVTSTKKGEPFKFTAIINFKDYFGRSEKEESDEEIEESEKGIIKAEYTLVNEVEDKSEHYTVIRLLGLKKTVVRIFEGQRNYVKFIKEKNKEYEKSVFKSMKDLLEYHFEKKKRSYSEDNEYIKFIIDLASYIPVEYVESGPIASVTNDKIIKEIVDQHKKLDFKVDLDGIFLKKPIFFPKKKDASIHHLSFKDTIKIEGSKEEIKVKGYYYIQHGIVYPREVNGVSIKIRGIPIAPQYGFDTTFMQFPVYLNRLFMDWISCELYVEKGLEDAMNIDRASFRLTHPHYLALQDYVHTFIHDKIIPITMEIYESGKEQRDKVKEDDRTQGKKRIVKSGKIKVQTKKANKENKAKKHGSSNTPIEIIKSSTKETVISVNQAYSKKFKKKDWDYLQDIFLIFEMSYKEAKGDAKKLKDLFYDKINHWKNID